MNNNPRKKIKATTTEGQINVEQQNRATQNRVAEIIASGDLPLFNTPTKKPEIKPGVRRAARELEEQRAAEAAEQYYGRFPNTPPNFDDESGEAEPAPRGAAYRAAMAAEARNVLELQRQVNREERKDPAIAQRVERGKRQYAEQMALFESGYLTMKPKEDQGHKKPPRASNRGPYVVDMSRFKKPSVDRVAGPGMLEEEFYEGSSQPPHVPSPVVAKSLARTLGMIDLTQANRVMRESAYDDELEIPVSVRDFFARDQGTGDIILEDLDAANDQDDILFVDVDIGAIDHNTALPGLDLSGERTPEDVARIIRENKELEQQLESYAATLEGYRGSAPAADLLGLPLKDGLGMYNMLKGLFTKVMSGDRISMFEDEDVRVALGKFLEFLIGAKTEDKKLAAGRYELFRFFYEINKEVEAPVAEPFTHKIKRWKYDYQRWVMTNPVAEDIRPNFNNALDTVLYKLTSSQIKACVDIIMNVYVMHNARFGAIYEALRVSLLTGDFQAPKVVLRELNPDSNIVEDITYNVLGADLRFYNELLYQIGVMMVIARDLWASGLTFTELMRKGEGYYECKDDMRGLKYIEAYPHLISKNNGFQFEGDRVSMALGVKAYCDKFANSYTLSSIYLKVSLKRIRYDLSEGKIRSNGFLTEGYWNVQMNLGSLPYFTDEEAMVLVESDFTMIIEHLRERVRRGRTPAIQAAYERQGARLQLVKGVNDPNRWIAWFENELERRVKVGYDRYDEKDMLELAANEEGEMRGKWNAGLIVCSFTITARRSDDKARANFIERAYPVHCKASLRRAYSALSVYDNTYTTALAGMCLYQAHWIAINLHQLGRTSALFRKDVRRDRMISDFKYLSDEHQNIFINGDVTQYRQKIMPANVVVILYEIDDWLAIKTGLTNAEQVTPIICWDGHAVCSSWVKIEKNFYKALAMDNKHHQVGNDEHKQESDRKGKKIIPVNGVEDKDLLFDDYFMDIETFDEVDDKGVNRMIPYLIVVVGKKLRFPKVFWGYNCKDDFLYWMRCLLQNHEKEKAEEKKKMQEANKKNKSVPIKRKFREINIWGFNSYHFDFIPFLRSWARWRGFKIQGSLTSVKTLKLGKATLYDLLRVIPMGSLATQAKTWKTPHQKMDFDHTKVNRDWLNNIHMPDKLECISYCINDCIVLQEVFEAYSDYVIKNFDISPYVFSAAALGYNIWRRSIAGKSFYIQGIEQGLYPKLHDSYKGGMVFITMKEMPPDVKEVYMYDRNSSYPAVMHQYDIPVSFNQARICDPPKQLRDLDVNLDVVSTDLYEIKNLTFDQSHWLPLVPKRTLDGLRYELTLNPIEYIWGVELREILRTGKVATGEILNIYIFNTEPIYKAFIEKIYKNRLQCKANNDILGDVFNKLIMNSVYGKKAQQLYPETMIVDDDKLLYYLNLNADNLLIESTDNLGDGLYKIEFSDIQYWKQIGSNINIASFITAGGRAAMCEAVRVVTNGWTEKCVMYGDTDSLLLTKKLPSHMVHETDLGKWKIEHTFTKWIGIGAKMYCGLKTDGEYKMRFKGVSRKHLSVEQYETLLKEGKANFKSGIVWRRHTDGYVYKTDDIKVIRPKDKRLFISSTESSPF